MALPKVKSWLVSPVLLPQNQELYFFLKLSNPEETFLSLEYYKTGNHESNRKTTCNNLCNAIYSACHYCTYPDFDKVKKQNVGLHAKTCNF